MKFTSSFLGSISGGVLYRYPAAEDTRNEGPVTYSHVSLRGSPADGEPTFIPHISIEDYNTPNPFRFNIICKS